MLDDDFVTPLRNAQTVYLHQGEVLTLTRGALISVPKRYDDIVEAVIDSTADHHGSWSAADAARSPR